MKSVTRFAGIGFAVVGVPLVALPLLALGACSSSSSSPATQGDAGGGGDGGAESGGTGTFTVHGTVLEKDTNKPLGGSIVIVEVGGLYQPNPNPNEANPFYKVSALAAADGTFSVDLPAGGAGFHTFQNGYYYGSLGVPDVAKAAALTTVLVKPLLPLDVKPTAKNLVLTPSTVSFGGQVKLTVDVAHAQPAGDAGPDAGSDPLSEEIIAAETTTHWSTILKPPTPGTQGVFSPDGTYTTTFTAPTKPGTYTYSLVVSSEGCITSDRLTATLTVQ